jgi:hypothetical protein
LTGDAERKSRLPRQLNEAVINLEVAALGKSKGLSSCWSAGVNCAAAIPAECESTAFVVPEL